MINTSRNLLSFFAFLLFASSCGIHSASIGNNHNLSTNVNLSKKNFTVLGRVSGASAATYVFGIGGLTNKSLLGNATSNMLDNADLTGGSKAIVNLSSETHYSLIVPFYYRKTVTVSANVIEFN